MKDQVVGSQPPTMDELKDEIIAIIDRLPGVEPPVLDMGARRGIDA